MVGRRVPDGVLVRIHILVPEPALLRVVR
jgi:hypothetical protein